MRKLYVALGIAAIIFMCIKAYVTNEYKTQENYNLAMNATTQVNELRKEFDKRLDEIDATLHQLDKEIVRMKERVKILPS